MESPRPLFIPVILGTIREGRMSEHAARLVTAEVAKRKNVTTELIDVRQLAISSSGLAGDYKDPEFAEKMMRADALIVVTPEYNHGYPGSLKQALDSCLKEYIHKAVGICGVSAGTFGGARVIENLLPVMRELGLVTIFWDVNFAAVQQLFDSSGALLDTSLIDRIDKFLKELIWMATVMRYGREHISQE